ncbi:helicase-related protein [Streptacidiphilus albus]|uniref:helicase-related protein n=1 Tax=Streptacidiphilus albus TaxID=105425 RepID=UPI00054C11A4|nr:helicase-related protein [Streptacidiphilus albus]
MTDPHSQHERFRAALVSQLCTELLGPHGPSRDQVETLTDWPVSTYTTGVLFPRTRREAAAENDEDLLAADHDDADTTTAVDETPDPGIPPTRSTRPSTTGITFAVDPARSRQIEIRTQAAMYDPVDAQGLPKVPERAEQRSTEQPDLRWRRRTLPLPVTSVDVMAKAGTVSDIPLTDGLYLHLRVRNPDDSGVLAVTAMLVNGFSVDPSDLKDPKCFFQVGLEITVPDGSGALVERPSIRRADDETLLTRLLYRHAPTFAVGHGCAAAWTWTPEPVGSAGRYDEPVGVSQLCTEHIPATEVLLADSNPNIPIADLGMQYLSEAPTAGLVHVLREFVAGYERWIVARGADADLLRGGIHGDDRTMALAHDQLKRCREAGRRMASGIELLERDPHALTAFRLANRVMALQRGRGQWIRKARLGNPEPEGTWRPFQLGFILLCLNSIVDDNHPEREIADLLWFPTGGGKTEAYLGLIAFTTFHRRLRLGTAGGGVTVLMRYTLRLLTLQQFERAALLICAMERVRAEQPERLGDEPVSIGMWVGKAATPNKLSEAAKSLRKLARGETLKEQNPVQLRHCPWCGTPLLVRDHEVNEQDGYMAIRCSNGSCDFSHGLPVHVVDHELYRVRPTLVIATADKFARIAWREDTAALFNRDTKRLHQKTPPPELVIQDELHLISGPLGTLAGLYEAAVDIACARPKIIASTATIRRAQEQGQALFDRAVVQFPPAGIDARDSWFAVEVSPGFPVEASHERKPSRLYVGLLAPGLSQATLLIRAYASLLHHAKHLKGPEEVRDAYWTLIGYFNSLRLLGAAELQVHTDVNERLRTLAGRTEAEAREVLPVEITSRVPSSALPDLLGALGLSLGTTGVLDVPLATNIISVGVDFDRLGLMVVTGQPQTTAEYIQATSRVGRAHPGLVVTLYNAVRSRDLSHYEGFTGYHSALYRQVESTSVTPFSPRARDKALHATFIGLLRLLHPQTRENHHARHLASFGPSIDSVREDLVKRVRQISPAEADHVDAEIRSFVGRWRRLVESNPDGLVYEAPYLFTNNPQRRSDTALLCTHQDRDLTEGRPTLWSLRDVDVESHLYLER